MNYITQLNGFFACCERELSLTPNCVSLYAALLHVCNKNNWAKEFTIKNMRSYRARASQEREYDMLPGDVKQFISALSDKMKLPDTSEYPTQAEINDRRNEIHRLLGEA